jgi:serine/threonine protein kinase
MIDAVMITGPNGYRIQGLQPFQQGGFGELMVGVRTDTLERVVVKFLKDPQSPEALGWFQRECRILLQRLHRWLMPVLAYQLEGPTPFYVMPWFERGNLEQHVGKLSDEDLMTVATQLGDVVAAMHAKRVWHGDLKPGNILLAEEAIRVSDPLGSGFGCTVSIGSKSGGTPGYCAPEVEASGAISAASDVYSLGATVFHMVTGERPEKGELPDFQRIQGSPARERLAKVVAVCCYREAWRRPPIQEVKAFLVEGTPFKSPGWRKAEEIGKAALVVGGVLAAVSLLTGGGK